MQDRPSAFTGLQKLYLLHTSISAPCVWLLHPHPNGKIVDSKPKWWHRGEKISDGKKIAIEAVVLGGRVWSYFRA